MPGVNILIKGTTIGTSTSVDGRYELEPPSLNDTLVVSFLGYERQEVPINGRSVIDISMSPDVEALEDIVVIGYGAKEQEKVTGSISSVPAESLENIPIQDLTTALQGRAAGVEIVRNGGDPGAAGAIRIRGLGTVNNSDPLIVIDGMPSDLSSLNNINSDDIKSVEILKDASSAAIYGNRAANGVVLVTTKRGNFDQDIQLSFNSSVGVSTPRNTLDVLEAPELAMLKRERFINDGIPVNPIWEDPQFQVQRTDWQDELLNKSFIQDYSLSVQGGSENSSFFVSGNFSDEQGLMESTFFDRAGLKINTDHKILSGRLRIKQNLSLSRTNRNTVNTSSAQSGVLWSAIRFHPGLPVKLDDGSFSSSQISSEFGDINNPIFTVEKDSDSNNEMNRVLGNVQAEFDILPGLSLRSNVGLDWVNQESSSFNIIIDDQIRQRSRNSLNIGISENTSVLSEFFLNFDTSVSENFNIDGVGGVVVEKTRGDNVFARRQDFASEDPSQRVLEAGSTINEADGTRFEDALVSYVGRVNLDYDDKYLLTSSIRYDGSSRFSSDNRWGVFPAFSAGWRISEEDFFRKFNSVVNSLRFTAGWGRTGNQNVARNQFLGLFGQNSQFSFQGVQVRGINQTRIPNEDITWETVETLNFGLHSSLFNNQVEFNFEYFDRDSKDVLLAPPLLGVQGTASVPDVNVGRIENKGVELILGYTKNINERLSLNVTGNATFINNKVIELNTDFLDSDNFGRQNQEVARTFEGSPIGTFFGWKTDGLYQNQQEINSDPNIANDSRKTSIQPGDVRFIDLNGDGQITSADRTILGSPQPDVTFGFTINSSYKNFNLNMHFAGAAGHQLFNADRMQGLDPTFPFNMYAETINRWNGEGTSNSIPRMTTFRNNQNHRSSDLWIESGNFLRMKTLSLSYTLPQDLMGTREIRVFTTAENLLTITSYSGIDPELGFTDGNLQRGVDFAQFPQPKTWTFGVNVRL